MNCRFCHATMLPGAMVCAQCGTAQTQASHAFPKKRLFLIVACVGCLVAIIAGYLIVAPILTARYSWQSDDRTVFRIAANTRSKLSISCRGNKYRLVVNPSEEISHIEPANIVRQDSNAGVIFRIDHNSPHVGTWLLTGGDAYRNAYGNLQGGSQPEISTEDKSLISSVVRAKRFYVTANYSLSDLMNVYTREPEDGFAEFDMDGVSSALEAAHCSVNDLPPY
jgi:hypothetical protein